MEIICILHADDFLNIFCDADKEIKPSCLWLQMSLILITGLAPLKTSVHVLVSACSAFMLAVKQL